jgi:hypothetical protein
MAQLADALDAVMAAGARVWNIASCCTGGAQGLVEEQDGSEP